MPDAPALVLSQDQQHAIARVLEWLADPLGPQRFTLGGFAGTGKTTVIREIVARCGLAVAVVALTGKAAYVLRTKGIDEACTLHSLIYKASDVCTGCGEFDDACIARCRVAVADLKPGDPRPKLCPRPGTRTRFCRVPFILPRLVIVDEASMINARIQRDLEEYGVRVLYVGDHGQLEPIGESTGLMLSPDVTLEQIHRQAAGSAVILFAHTLRKGAPAEAFGNRHPDVELRRRVSAGDLDGFDMILCGRNKTRVAVNARVREQKGFRGALPCPGERVVCLKNNTDLGLFNGMLASVLDCKPLGAYTALLSIVRDDGVRLEDLYVDPRQFGAERKLDRPEEDRELFDFGHALTVHKAQGSEWDRVCVLEQVMGNWSAPRWRYTAATRAARSLRWCVR